MNFIQKCGIAALAFLLCSWFSTYAGIIDMFGKITQNIVTEENEKERLKNLLKEIRTLPQAPKLYDYPQAKSFTLKHLLDAANAFVDVMQQRLDKAKWLSGGTESYLFVRKLILPEGSIIEFRGDLHGDVHSLIRWLDSLRDKGWLDANNPFKLIKKDRYIAFLGDYTDRGHYGAEVMYIIMQLFLHNPDHVLIVRGNHEDLSIISAYGFKNELEEKFSLDQDQLGQLIAVYDYMPVAMYLGCKNKKTGGVDFIQCCHGGMEFGYDSRPLLHDKDNGHANMYEWLDQELEKKRGDIACARHVDIQDLLAKCVCGKKKMCALNGFQWNDFDFFNQSPFSLPDLVYGRGYLLHQEYTTRLLEDSTAKNSKNKVLAVFRAHQHDGKTVQHILDYGNGVYKLWHNTGSTSPISEGFDWIAQWSGDNSKPVSLDPYSVWTFNVAPRTGAWDKSIARPESFSYDTVARLELASGFENWTLYPRQIPVT